ncbi:hypothetical protein CVS40_5503 [Lucilia cuprina]|nr:hypothetical protein CVS40_5503 [Lucilia cuprina]
MKTIICHLFILVVVALSHNQQTEAAATNVEIGKKAVEECIKEGSLNGNDTSRIINGEIFSISKIGVIGADGQQKPENLMKYLQSRFPEDKDKIKPALAKCTNIKSSNPCEVVHKFEGCVIENIVGNK